jgi:hypothetical protein
MLESLSEIHNPNLGLNFLHPSRRDVEIVASCHVSCSLSLRGTLAFRKDAIWHRIAVKMRGENGDECGTSSEL